MQYCKQPNLPKNPPEAQLAKLRHRIHGPGPELERTLSDAELVSLTDHATATMVAAKARLKKLSLARELASEAH